MGWLYFMAQSLTTGQRQYADFIEANPPLILWLYSVPAWIASVLDVSSILSLRLFILLSAAGSLYLANQVLKRLFEPEQLMDTTMELARKLASMPTKAIGLTKRLINQSYGNDLTTQLEAEAFAQTTAARTDDHFEGVRAFSEKRPPKFTGK